MPSVLIVEDDDVVRKLMKLALEAHGYDVVATATPPAARTVAASRDFDLLVADVLMPGGTGPELWAELSQLNPDLRVLFVSGHEPETMLHLSQLGPKAFFLAKPFSGEEIVSKVRAILDDRAP